MAPCEPHPQEAVGEAGMTWVLGMAILVVANAITASSRSRRIVPGTIRLACSELSRPRLAPWLVPLFSAVSQMRF